MKINVLGEKASAAVHLTSARYLNLYSASTVKDLACTGGTFDCVDRAVRSRAGGYPGCVVKIEPITSGDFNMTIVREFK